MFNTEVYADFLTERATLIDMQKPQQLMDFLKF